MVDAYPHPLPLPGSAGSNLAIYNLAERASKQQQGVDVRRLIKSRRKCSAIYLVVCLHRASYTIAHLSWVWSAITGPVQVRQYDDGMNST